MSEELPMPSVITFTVHNESAFGRNIEFVDLANNNHATMLFQPNEDRPLSLEANYAGDGAMQYRYDNNAQWFIRRYIKASDTVNV
jgi:hypothetical protein